MTDIPDDIMKAVRDELAFEHFAYEDKADYEAGYKGVTRLILAERERCAEVARSYAIPARDQDGNICGYYGPGPTIAAAIMKGTTT